MGTLMVFAPFFGNAVIPPRTKAGLAFLLTLVLFPFQKTAPAIHQVAAWVSTLGSEAIVGLMMGLLMSFVFEAVMVAGQISGFQMGLNMEAAIDPTTQASSPVLGVAYESLAMLVFLSLDLHYWVLKGIASSYSYLPVGAARITVEGAKTMIRASGHMMLVGVELAAPILAATLVTDLLMGFMSKASPQIPIIFTAIPVKVVIGLMLFGLTVGLWPRLLGDNFHRALAGTEHLWVISR